MAREMDTQYVAYKYANLTRWEFRHYDDNECPHVVVWDSVRDSSFCVISFAEMKDEFNAANRVRDYAMHDLDDIAPSSKLRDDWADAVTRGIIRGIRQTITNAA